MIRRPPRTTRTDTPFPDTTLFRSSRSYSWSMSDDLFGSVPTTPIDYDASHIEVLEGLEPVRRRPGMHIGGTDERALHHLASEVLDNSKIGRESCRERVCQYVYSSVVAVSFKKTKYIQLTI